MGRVHGDINQSYFWILDFNKIHSLVFFHQEVASDSFCFLINSSWLLVFILYVFSLFFEIIFFGSQRISFLSLVKNCNHKGLGIYYLLSAFIFGISGTLISVLIRIELYSSGNRIISPDPC